MRKLAIIYNAIVISILTVVGFLGVTSYPQLASSIIFYPLAIYFWSQLVPRTQEAIPTLPELHKSPIKPVAKTTPA
ncbi:MAG: hypothetical protein ACMG6E_05505, partial [Candidatus Roizmanbacteria bacterium]